jgi:hypothetical protein
MFSLSVCASSGQFAIETRKRSGPFTEELKAEDFYGLERVVSTAQHDVRCPDNRNEERVHGA